MYRPTKYRARKTTIDGITFDSKAEAKRWVELSDLEKHGEIASLQRQVKFELIPKQIKDGKVIERAVSYIADFTYYRNGSFVVEDVKGGVLTPEYKIKRKLMLWKYGVVISEVTNGR